MSFRTVTTARALLLAGAAITAILPQAAFAQEQEPAAVEDAAQADEPLAGEAPEESGDIVVTARRRAEALQDVPIAVTAYSGAQLEREGAIDITDVGDTTPNVTLEVSRGTNSTLTAFIRGIGQQDPVAGFEQGVGIYLDDVYLNRPQGTVLDIYDVERIEILRGPQGTLYGRNTIGGAVKYVTRRLSDQPEVNLRGTVGTYGQLDAVASASYPIADIFRVGVAGARLTRDGFGSNFTTGKDNYDKDVIAGRVSAEIGRDDSAMLRLSGDYTKDNSHARGGHRLITSLFTGAPVLDNVFNTRGGLDDIKQEVTNKGVAAHGQLEVAEGFTLKSITAFRKDESTTPIDFDALPSIDVDVPGIYKNKQFSQEVQLEVERGALSGVVGAYYLDADAQTIFDVRLFTTFNGFTAFTDSDVNTKTWAIFGDFTYDITDQIAVSLGWPLYQRQAARDRVPSVLPWRRLDGVWWRRNTVRPSHIEFRRQAERHRFHAPRIDQLQAERRSPYLRQLFTGLQRRRLRPARPVDPGARPRWQRRRCRRHLRIYDLRARTGDQL